MGTISNLHLNLAITAPKRVLVLEWFSDVDPEKILGGRSREFSAFGIQRLALSNKGASREYSVSSSIRSPFSSAT